MNEQHQKVHCWLQKVFADEQIPSFEVNPQTTAILNRLVDINTKKDEDVKILCEDLAEKTEEYKSEAKRLQRIVTSIGVPLSNLSQSGSTSVQTLAKTALILDLKNTKISSYILALNKLSEELHSIKMEKMQTKHALRKLLRKTNNTVIKYDALKKACETLEEEILLQEPILEQRLKETTFLKEKSEDYQRQLHQFENRQKQVKLEPGLYHKSLERKYEDVMELEKELKPLHAKLETYHALPPDISLAKVKLEEAKRELEALEEELSKNIDSCT